MKTTAVLSLYGTAFIATCFSPRLTSLNCLEGKRFPVKNVCIIHQSLYLALHIYFIYILSQLFNYPSIHLYIHMHKYVDMYCSASCLSTFLSPYQSVKWQYFCHALLKHSVLPTNSTGCKHPMTEIFWWTVSSANLVQKIFNMLTALAHRIL